VFYSSVLKMSLKTIYQYQVVHGNEAQTEWFFPYEEIKKMYPTFRGSLIYTNGKIHYESITYPMPIDANKSSFEASEFNYVCKYGGRFVNKIAIKVLPMEIANMVDRFNRIKQMNIQRRYIINDMVWESRGMSNIMARLIAPSGTRKFAA